ncbi:MAG: class I SAM-dependent methyltransferase [bacterium]
MQDYYTRKLAAERLRLCYEIAPSRVKRYLEAEVNFVLHKMQANDRVLELGCGYGRVLSSLAPKAKLVIGIDTAFDSLILAKQMLRTASNVKLIQATAADTGFKDGQFEAVVCIQNGISAFKVSPLKLLREAVRVTCTGGTVLFSSYAEAFWPHRLQWFQIQAERGLIGEIDHDATGDGVIVCKDGFRASTFRPEQFAQLAAVLDMEPNMTEVDDSSLFCELQL